MKEQLIKEYRAIGFNEVQADIMAEQFINNPNKKVYGEGDYSRTHAVACDLNSLINKEEMEEENAY